MKVFFVTLLTCIQFLSTTQAKAQTSSLPASPVTSTLYSFYTESYTWPGTHLSHQLNGSYSRVSAKCLQMAYAQGTHLLGNFSLQAAKGNLRTDSANQNSPYRIRFKKDGPLTGVDIGLYGASALLKVKEKPLSSEKVLGLEKNHIWVVDRGATRQYSRFAQKASDLLLTSSMAMPLLYLTKEKTRKDYSHIFIMQAETFLLTTGLITLTKTIVFRPRPFTYNRMVPIDTKLSLNARESFFSGHVATTASMSFFTAISFSAYFPCSPLKPFVWTYAIVWPAATGYFRYAAGKHFPTDILTGYVVGAVTGIIVPKIHQKIRKRKKICRVG